MHEVILGACIGRGGNGEIHRGYFKETNKKCIIKKVGKGRMAYSQLKNEGRILKFLGEAGFNGAPALYGECDDALIMEEIYGEALDQLAVYRMSESELKALFINMTKIVSGLHGIKPPVIHRDIKPSNIMMDKSGRLIFIDFGTAKILYGFGQENKDIKSGIMAAGTKGYAAPEQYGGLGSESFQADIYQLGKTMEKLLDKSCVSGRFELDMRNVIRRCCRPDALERYISADDVRKDLLGVRTHKNYKILRNVFWIIRTGVFRRRREIAHDGDIFIDIVRTYDTIEFL
ncbi:serine/threonine protein kinase [Butyrivibrio sp. JL13D10]|uniref:serine/threonine protein kinase n=1 Tax=Butyrivibrio sp. JL13D10 TaxID=3236815 RepID=UPI0038B623EB